MAVEVSLDERFLTYAIRSLCDGRRITTDVADSIWRKRHLAFRNKKQKEAHNKMGLGETPRRLIRKCRYSSGAKFEEVFEIAFVLTKKSRRMQHFRSFFEL